MSHINLFARSLAQGMSILLKAIWKTYPYLKKIHKSFAKMLQPVSIVVVMCAVQLCVCVYMLCVRLQAV